MAYVISIIDGNGKKMLIKVSYEIYRFEKNYLRKEIRDIQEFENNLSYEELCELNENFYMAIPDELTAISCETENLNNFSKEELHKAIDQLPEKQRRRFILRYVYKLTVPEIASIEKCDESAVEAGLRKSLKFLRKVCAICR